MEDLTRGNMKPNTKHLDQFVRGARKLKATERQINVCLQRSKQRQLTYTPSTSSEVLAHAAKVARRELASMLNR